MNIAFSMHKKKNENKSKSFSDDTSLIRYALPRLDKFYRMIHALRPFFSSYSHFTGFMTYNKLRREKSNVGILPAKRSHSNYNMPKLMLSF